MKNNNEIVNFFHEVTNRVATKWATEPLAPDELPVLWHHEKLTKGEEKAITATGFLSQYYFTPKKGSIITLDHDAFVQKHRELSKG